MDADKKAVDKAKSKSRRNSLLCNDPASHILHSFYATRVVVGTFQILCYTSSVLLLDYLDFHFVFEI